MRAALAVPSAITFTRILFFPYLAKEILRGNFSWAAVLCFVVALTDNIDGWVARRWRLETRFGAALDPVADKLLMVTVFLSLYGAGAVPGWLVAVIFGRDAAILLVAGATLLLTPIRDFAPSRWGKLSTFLQVFAACMTLIWRAGWFGDIWWVAWFAWGLCAAVTAGSGLHYLYLWKRRVWG
jgi:cardiolipin synthase